MARMTACLTFDFDAMLLWVQRGDGATEISRGEFGAFSMPRILSLLERHSILTTFFIPGHTALAYPDLVRRIRDAGHEIGHHGWVHENAGADGPDVERLGDAVFEPLEAYARRWRSDNPLDQWLASDPVHAGLNAIRLDGSVGVEGAGQAVRTVIAHGTRLVRTFVRGTTVYGDGAIQVQPGFGRFPSSQEAAVAVGV